MYDRLKYKEKRIWFVTWNLKMKSFKTSLEWNLLYLNRLLSESNEKKTINTIVFAKSPAIFLVIFNRIDSNHNDKISVEKQIEYRDLLLF